MKNILVTKKAFGIMAFAVVFTVALLSQSAFAKGRGQRGPDPERRLEMMTITLDLTKEQRDAILPILTSEAEEMKAVHEKYREKGRDSKGQAREEMDAIHTKYSDLIVAQLTDQQAEKYYKLEALRHKNRGNGKGGGRGQNNEQ